MIIGPSVPKMTSGRRTPQTDSPKMAIVGTVAYINSGVRHSEREWI